MVYISNSVGLHLRLSCFTSQTSCFTPHVGLHLCWFDSVGIHIRLTCYNSHLYWFTSQILLVYISDSVVLHLMMVYISVGLHFVFIWFISQILSDATLGLLAFVQLYINIHQHILKRQCVNTENVNFQGNIRSISTTVLIRYIKINLSVFWDQLKKWKQGLI